MIHSHLCESWKQLSADCRHRLGAIGDQLVEISSAINNYSDPTPPFDQQAGRHSTITCRSNTSDYDNGSPKSEAKNRFQLVSSDMTKPPTQPTNQQQGSCWPVHSSPIANHLNTTDDYVSQYAINGISPSKQQVNKHFAFSCDCIAMGKSSC